MNKKWLNKIKKILISESELVRNRIFNSGNMEIEDTRGDEGDSAQAIYQAHLDTRFQGRDLRLLHKIEYALNKIENGTFGICEDCEEQIAIKRLEARPVTTLCVNCKEAQERNEGSYSEI